MTDQNRSRYIREQMRQRDCLLSHWFIHALTQMWGEAFNLRLCPTLLCCVMPLSFRDHGWHPARQVSIQGNLNIMHIPGWNPTFWTCKQTHMCKYRLSGKPGGVTPVSHLRPHTSSSIILIAGLLSRTFSCSFKWEFHQTLDKDAKSTDRIKAKQKKNYLKRL